MSIWGWLIVVAVVGFGVQAQIPGLSAGRGPAHAYQAEMSYSGAGALEGDGWRGGDVDAFAVRASYSHRFELAPGWWANTGLGWDNTRFGVPSGAPLPESVTAVAARTGVQWRPAQQWTLLVEARPGLFSDLEDVDWADVNVPVMIGAGYEISTNLTVGVGVGINWWSRLATIGGPGLTWRFAEHWRLNLILPRPSVDWTLTRTWAVFAGGEMRGGGWRVAEDFGRSHGDPDLDGDRLGYREIRVGGGARWALGPALRLSLEVGYVVDREFEFRNSDRELRGGGAPYVQFGVGGGF